jgi:hypothetical protein
MCVNWKMVNRRAPLTSLLTLGLFFLSSPASPCELTGSVKSNAVPLANATVTMTQGGKVVTSTTTSADGTYKLAYPEFPQQLRAAVVSVDVPGFTEDRRNLFRRGNSRCLEVTVSHVVLEKSSETPADFSMLGQTIFISSYALYGNNTDTIADRFNRDLPNIIHHKILAYKSSLGQVTSDVDISVIRLAEPVTPAEGERMFRLGHMHNALAVIAGDGELMPSPQDGDVFSLTSVFRTIPIYADVRIGIQPIIDQIPVRNASPSHLANGLQDYWGKQAMLSFVLQRLATHQGSWNAQELNHLSDILIDVRNTMQSEDRLLDVTNQLLQIVDAEHAP